VVGTAHPTIRNLCNVRDEPFEVDKWALSNLANFRGGADAVEAVAPALTTDGLPPGRPKSREKKR